MLEAHLKSYQVSQKKERTFFLNEIEHQNSQVYKNTTATQSDTWTSILKLPNSNVNCTQTCNFKHEIQNF